MVAGYSADCPHLQPPPPGRSQAAGTGSRRRRTRTFRPPVPPLKISGTAESRSSPGELHTSGRSCRRLHSQSSLQGPTAGP